MNTTVVIRSSITGIHRTKVSSHKDITLAVERDDSVHHIDPQCMKVMFPDTVPDELKNEITWPKNLDHNRKENQLVKDCLGKKVGNVPANLAGFFRKLINLSTYVTQITW